MIKQPNGLLPTKQRTSSCVNLLILVNDIAKDEDVTRIYWNQYYRMAFREETNNPAGVGAGEAM